MAVDLAFSVEGVHRRVVCEVNDTETLLDLVTHRLGVAVIPRPRDVDPRKLRCIPIKGREPLWEISLLTTNPRPINPAARALIDAVLADQSPVAETAAR